jgi:PhnB protein
MKSEETSAAQKIQPVPAGYSTVTPFIIVKGASKLLDFMKAAFGAVEMSRTLNEDGTIAHAEARIGDSAIMLFDAKENWPETPAFLCLYVDDCDATYEQAIKAGAHTVTKLTNMPWGDRMCRVSDRFGNVWWLMTRIENVSNEKIRERSLQQKYIDAMQYAQSADFFPLHPNHHYH